MPILEGTTGDDTLNGGTESDIIKGLEGNDKINGGEGHDSIEGGIGNDILQGGEGPDHFIIDGYSTDLITDFNPSEGDIIEINSTTSGLASMSHVVEAISTVGDNTRILFSSGASLNIKNNNFSLPLSESSFILIDRSGAEPPKSQLDGVSVAGTSGGDRLKGNDYKNTIYGEKGDDTLEGFGGDDKLFGGAENDHLFGFSGDDTLLGEKGDDLLYGNSGDNTLEGGAGADKFYIDGTGHDVITDFSQTEGDLVYISRSELASLYATQVGDDVIIRLSATSTLKLLSTNKTDLSFTNFSVWSRPSSANDLGLKIRPDGLLVGSQGDDTIYGSNSNNTFIGDKGDDSFSGFSGIDTVDYSNDPQAVYVDLTNNTAIDGWGNSDTFKNINHVIGTKAGVDTLLGSEADDTLDGGSNHDNIRGGDGNDSLIGGLGNDRIFAGADDKGSDTITGNGGDDILGGGAGHDVIVGGDGTPGTVTGNDTLYGGPGNDIIVGGSYFIANHKVFSEGFSSNELWGGDGIDTIYGDGGNDLVGAGRGDDQIETGAGHDTVFGGKGDDNNDDRIATGSGDDIVYASTGDDFVAGEEGNDTLYGGSGNDHIIGGKGTDLIFGGAGNDQLSGGADSDTFSFYTDFGSDTITDFGSGDKLDFTNINGLTIDVIQSDAVYTDGNTTLTLDSHGTLILQGVTESKLQSFIDDGQIIVGE